MPVAYRRAALIPGCAFRCEVPLRLPHVPLTAWRSNIPREPRGQTVISHAVGLPENANHAALNVASTIHLLQVRSTNNEPARLD
jgi:hypothetical protein